MYWKHIGLIHLITSKAVSRLDLKSYYICLSKTKEAIQSLKVIRTWQRLCVCVYVLVAQSCSTLNNPMDCSPPATSVHRLLQATTLGWVAMPFSRGFPDPGLNPDFPYCSKFFTIWATRGSLTVVTYLTNRGGRTERSILASLTW